LRPGESVTLWLQSELTVIVPVAPRSVAKESAVAPELVPVSVMLDANVTKSAEWFGMTGAVTLTEGAANSGTAKADMHQSTLTERKFRGMQNGCYRVIECLVRDQKSLRRMNLGFRRQSAYQQRFVAMAC